MINVCFITDENYVLPTLVAIQSLIVNSKHKVCVNVVSSQLSEDSQKLFKQLATSNCKINIIISSNPGDSIDTKHLYVSKAAMLKFALPQIFSDLDKILYIDGDVLILDDLNKFWITNLKNNYIAAVADMAGMVEEKHHKKFGFDKYFNSGVMLLNLKKMRQDDCTSKLIENKKNDVFKHFMDQDALNQTFNQKVLWLHPKYNMMRPNLKYSMKEIAQFYGFDIADIKYCYKNPVILHLTNMIKVWKDVNCPDFKIWYNYFNMLPASEFKNKQNNVYKKANIHKRINAVTGFIKSLFYKCKGNKKKYRFFGIPLFYTRKEQNKKVISVLGIKIKYNK